MLVGNGDRTVVVAVVEKPAVEAMEKVDASLVDNPLIFPDEDFLANAYGREDDEEGLEFLGTEGELASSDQRDNGEEDSLSDSGLDGVRDVPSWVEAIGIVIAGNMDSRKQPPQT